MCGRYVSVQGEADLVEEFDVEEVLGDELAPSWNIAPTDPVRAVVERPPHGEERGGRQLRTMRWGLVPSWSKDARSGARMINARIETVTSKPAFTKAAAARRCLLPALGYYEWQQHEGGKTPYFLHDPAGEPLSFAGLFELWRDPAKADDDPTRWLWTCTVITQQADDVLGQIHDRNPVIVPSELRAAWLDCSSGSAEVAERLLAEIPPARLAPYAVGPEVGNVRNNGPALIEPAGAAARPVTQPQQLSLLE